MSLPTTLYFSVEAPDKRELRIELRVVPYGQTTSGDQHIILEGSGDGQVARLAMTHVGFLRFVHQLRCYQHSLNFPPSSKELP